MELKYIFWERRRPERDEFGEAVVVIVTDKRNTLTDGEVSLHKETLRENFPDQVVRDTDVAREPLPGNCAFDGRLGIVWRPKSGLKQTNPSGWKHEILGEGLGKCIRCKKNYLRVFCKSFFNPPKIAVP